MVRVGHHQAVLWLTPCSHPHDPQGQLGALNAESYCERILSCSNLVMTDGNTMLSDEEVEMLVVLRMNRKWMVFMREHYKGTAMELFGQTVVGRA